MKEIKLTQGAVALVDDEYYDYLSQWKWWLHDSPTDKQRYAKRGFLIKGRRVDIMMHRMIIRSSKELLVDHRDGDGLNNTVANLRGATLIQNSFNSNRHCDNSSKYKGVHWHKNRHRWYINVYGKNSGSYTDEDEAALAYNEKAKEVYGEFARLNIVGVCNG